MSCCATTITPFNNVATSTVPYSGLRPTVDVLYLQPDNTWLAAGVFTQVEITPTEVVVTHGGLSSGLIKLLQ